MSRLKLGLVIVSVAFIVVGCGAGKYDDYKKAPANNEPLVLPRDLNKGSLENQYAIPKIKHQNHQLDVSTLPPESRLPIK